MIPYGRHISAKADDMAQATMCAYPKYDNALPHRKFLLRCCSECPCINTRDQETDNHNIDTTPSIRFHIYHIIGCCTAHDIIQLKDKTYVACVNNNLHQMNIQKYTTEDR